ncbi:LysM and putative peptidoglycan-binding domain-containing protein 2 [Camellia lanceoleosa]|uniref:LysM and putative peptidoglycan-binding domain-containing protein 2 n=1 Tax=Camellia lanceoleosa TaxID=1840588 RepID=A0ACC0G6C8_9ERIC|nr:LysM and putative peptidoglycan-binding domain-containing protein 2 [Camellia lanceoleosa]
MQQVICRGLFRVFEDRIEFLMEREKHDNGNFYYLNHHHHHQEVDRVSPDRMVSSSSSSSSLLARPSTPPMPPSSCSPVGGLSYIEHRVSKMDTLAGVAIKYGVEVADIKRLNGLVTDLQMFALKTLNIPLPGRHPPSPILSNGLDSQGSGGFSAITGKGLALRPKAANRTAAGVEAEPGFLNRIPIALADSLVADGFNSVRKSSSTSSLHEQENSTSSLLVWPTSKWNLKPDLQALSTAAVTGLPKPTTGRKNKAALD